MNNGKVCVSVAAETVDELIEKIRRADDLADVIEVRFDRLNASEVALLQSQISNLKFQWPLIATFRATEQGGTRGLTIRERAAFWSRPIDGLWADVEEDIVDIAEGWPFRIVSYHDHDGAPSDIVGKFERLSRCNADAVKIAVYAHDADDALPVWKLLADATSFANRIVPIAMGEAGKWTRILGLANGAFLTYASLDEGSEIAPGQLTVHDLTNVYRVKQLDKATKVYGVIGDPVSASLSPYIHNAAFAALGLNSVFIPLQVKDLDAFFKRMVLPATCEVELNFAGFAVTMPHKQAVIKYLDEIDADATQIGAVNTIDINDGKLRGSNTDTVGFITPLKARFGRLDSSRIAVLGAGGAARACVHALKQERADVTVFVRDNEKADRFAAEFGVTAHPFSDLRSRISDFDVLVNATPIGMKGEFQDDLSPLTADQLKGVKLVFDLVTSSKDTSLMREAGKAGIETISGVEMLIEQAVKQFEIWTGRDAPREVMRTAALTRMEKAK